VNTRIRSGRADSSDVAELTRLQEALELEYSRASPAEQKKFKSIKQKLAGMLADMKSDLQKKLRTAADDQRADADSQCTQPAVTRNASRSEYKALQCGGSKRAHTEA